MIRAGKTNAVRLFAALFGLTMAGTPCVAEEEPDTELLEFLGDQESGDEQWQEFFDSIPVELTGELQESDTHERSKQRDSD